jgi:hypothetical protein
MKNGCVAAVYTVFIRFKMKYRYAPLAQLAERGSDETEVSSSILLGSIFLGVTSR